MSHEQLTRPQAVQIAREMWDDGDGWKIFEIRAYLADRGVNVSRETVRAWADPEWWEQRRKRMAEIKRRHDRDARGTLSFKVIDEDAMQRFRAAASAAPLASPVAEATPDLLLALRLEDGLTYGAIAKVATRLLGEPMTEQQARYRLIKLGAPKNENKAAATRAQVRRQQMRAAA